MGGESVDGENDFESFLDDIGWVCQEKVLDFS